jgi:hypothetical protein
MSRLMTGFDRNPEDQLARQKGRTTAGRRSAGGETRSCGAGLVAGQNETSALPDSSRILTHVAAEAR